MNKINNQSAKKYNNIKLRITLIELLLSLFFWIVIIKSGLNFTFGKIAASFSPSTWIQFYLYAGILGFLNFIFSVPLSFYSGFLVEKKFHLSNQNLLSWLKEQLKGLFVGIFLMVIILSGFYFILIKFPDFWWIGVWIFFLIFGILLTQIAPVLIFPLFYKFKPIQDSELEKRLIDFATKWKFHIKGIFQFNLSKTTKKANAAFTGIGKSRRVILGDTLLEKFSIEEIETVFAHEIGHYIHKHLLKGILFNSLMFLLGLYLIFIAYSTIIRELDMVSYQMEALPYLALLFLVYSLITGPISNDLSRKFEYQADSFAVKSTNNIEIFKNSLLKLSQLNLADENPHPVVEFLLYSHPSIKKRIQKISGEH